MATLRLMQESGVSGPVATVVLPASREGQEQAAREWAAGQTGHPWDVLVIETDDECREVEQ